ncbi:MAG TPA: hypothetical protein PLP17_17195, partial [Oligoflexia bacterium]|nr:hypothetical protein [Oligoflexia bacterium]
TQPGDKFLLCSDGLYNLVLEEEILENLAAPDIEDAVKKLVQLALERGGSDNVTVQIVEAVMLDNEEFSIQYPEGDAVSCRLSTNAEVGDLPALMDTVKLSTKEEQSSAGHADERPSAQSEPAAPSEEAAAVPAEPAGAASDEPAAVETGPAEAQDSTTEPAGTLVQETSTEFPEAFLGAAGEETAGASEEFLPLEEETGFFNETAVPAADTVQSTGREPEAEALRQYERAYQQENEQLTKMQYVIVAMLLVILMGVGYALLKTKEPGRKVNLAHQTNPLRTPSVAPMYTIKHNDLRKEIADWAAQRQTGVFGEGKELPVVPTEPAPVIDVGSTVPDAAAKMAVEHATQQTPAP